MGRRPKKPKYTGILAKPRAPWGPLTMIDTDAEIKRRADVDAAEFTERLEAVLDHYSIDRRDPIAMTRLVYALLVEHVPGFRRERGRGRGREWTVHRNAALVAAVRSMVKPPDFKEADAIRKLVKERRFGSATERSLRRRFDEAAKDPIISAFEKFIDISHGRLSWADIAAFHSAENEA